MSIRVSPSHLARGGGDDDVLFSRVTSMPPLTTEDIWFKCDLYLLFPINLWEKCGDMNRGYLKIIWKKRF